GYNDSVGVGRAYGILGGLGTGLAEAAGLATAGGVGKGKPNTIKQNWPTTRKELTDDLSKKGFGNPRTSEGGYVTYKGSDSKEVIVKPTGEVIVTQKVWAKDGSKKYPQRLDYDGNRLSDQSHSTGHFVK
ncbi:hypothetical protein, partial [Leptospira alstonii]|uniref:hypothetical protein n=1 Tax=Leptospira alstonii TaxID=28452 RepID=UPI000B123E99